jgi:hypothetical protein
MHAIGMADNEVKLLEQLLQLGVPQFTLSVNEKIKPPLFTTISHCVFIRHVYSKDTVGYSCEQRWFNLIVDIQAQLDAPTQDKDTLSVFQKVMKGEIAQT